MLRATAARAIGFVATCVALSGIGFANVIVVDGANGPGTQFTSIQPAVNAASDGDVLLIRAGTYDAATIHNKALTLVGDGAVQIETPLVFNFVAHPFVISGLSTGKRIVFRGLAFAGGSYNGSTWDAVDAFNNDGTLWFDSCTIGAPPYSQPDSYGNALWLAKCDDVVMTHCTLIGGIGFVVVGAPQDGSVGRPALYAESSNVYVHASTLDGGHGYMGYARLFSSTNSTPGAAAATFVGGTGTSALFTSCSLNGGTGGDGFLDFTGQFCNGGQPGGSALWLQTGNPVVRVVDSLLVPGASGIAPPACSPAPPAPPTKVDSGSLIFLPGVPGDFTVPSPLREAQSSSLSISDASGASALVLIGAAPASILFPQYAGALHVGGAVVVAVLGTVPGSGTLQVPIVVPTLPPGLLGVDVFLQGSTCPPSAPCTLTPPAVVTVLDSSL